MSSFADHSAARVHFASRRGQDGAVDVDLGSLSSVDAADAPPGDDSSLGLYDETMPLYQRLHELDQLTASFLQSRLDECISCSMNRLTDMYVADR